MGARLKGACLLGLALALGLAGVRCFDVRGHPLLLGARLSAPARTGLAASCMLIAGPGLLVGLAMVALGKRR